MAKGYLQGVDLDQGCLLPEDMRTWLPVDDPVWFFRDVIAGLDLSAFEAGDRRGGAGRAGYSPATLLSVLIFGYAQGLRSSRKLERACQHSVAFRVLVGGLQPDHTTIARFRAAHEHAVQGLFAQVLVLCAEAGLVDLDVVAIDGTKIHANASGLANADGQRLQRRLDAARVKAREALAQAAVVDAAEDAEFGSGRGDVLSEDLVDADARVRWLRQVQQQLAQQEAAAAAARDAQQAKAEKWLQDLADPDQPVAGRRPPSGVDPVERAEASLARERESARRRKRQQGGDIEDLAHVKRAVERVAKAKAAAAGKPRLSRAQQRLNKPSRVNLTDPQSQAMTSAKGWVQGYNAQLAVSADQIVIAVDVVNDPVDVGHFVPLMQQCQRVAADLAKHRDDPDAGQIGVVLADAGYCSRANLTAAGPDRMIATSRKHKLPRGEPDRPATDDPLDQMTHRLRTSQGRALYGKRGTTVEPVNGHLKTITGLRQLSRRGLAAAQAEVQLAATVLNLNKLMRARAASQ